MDGLRKRLNDAALAIGRPFGSIEVLPVNWHRAVHADNDELSGGAIVCVCVYMYIYEYIYIVVHMYMYMIFD